MGEKSPHNVHLPLGGKPQASYKPNLPTKKIRYLEQKKDTNINRYLDPKDLVSKDAASLYIKSLLLALENVDSSQSPIFS